MKRAPFLLAGSAAMLAGCGGGHALTRAIPGADAPAARTSKLVLVPATPDPISANVLANPIVGEARRFTGAVAPANWMLAQGQTLSSTAYPALAQLLGQPNGKLKTTFQLPNPGFGLIVAVAGVQMTKPSQLTSSARRPSETVSLGPNARPGKPYLEKPLSAAALEERRLAQTSVHVTSSTPAELSAADRARISAATAEARSAALGALSPATRTQLDGAIDDAVAGRTDLHAAVTSTASALTAGEIAALNAANGDYVRPFNAKWTPSESADARLAAASFLLSVAITPEQAQTIGARE
jgi:microcystin-dependent protein